jgi:hypothetical protein
MDIYNLMFRLAGKVNSSLPTVISEFSSTSTEIALSKLLRNKIQIKVSKSEIKWYSQLGQDQIAYVIDEYKPTRFFVEFGATDGLTLSNTASLEFDCGWTGLLAEPGRQWHKNLINNRRAIIDKRCVWNESGKKLLFREQGELSGVDTFLTQRSSKDTYEVETISLNDLLNQVAAPNEIGLLSADTEGSEYLILSSLDFETYKFNFIAVEHNYRVQRLRILRLLRKNGYFRVLLKESQWDDWFIHESIAARILGN